MSEHNLNATVFVYRSYKDRKIKAEYIDKARLLEDSADWEHIATLEPRMWIEFHYEKIEMSKKSEALAEQPSQQCKYGNEPVSCTSSPMDCQCALDAVFEQPAQQQEKYCSACQGRGQVDTGINESPVTSCNACNGTGLKKLTAPKFVRNVDGVPCITLVEHEHLMRDLLEALKNLVMVSQHLGACEATVEDARKVIAKATGERNG